MAYRYPIYRANEANLRRQIMEALEQVAKWPVVQTYVGPGDYAIVPAGSQMIVYGGFLIDGGFLQLDGELVILGAAYRDEHEHPPYTLDASAGLFELDGGNANLAAAMDMAVDAGAYTYTGANATLTGP